jgi:hypothetical protein
MHMDTGMSASTTTVRSAGMIRWNAAGNRALVTAYKLIGFLLLTVILIGIVSFVGLHAFYLVHRSWVMPRVVSPGDPEVIELRSRLAEEVSRQQALLAEQRGIEAKLQRLRLIAEAELSFQAALPAAMESDVVVRRETVAALKVAREAQRRAGYNARHLSQAVHRSSLEQLKRDYQAKLISQEQLLDRTYELSRLAQAGSSSMGQDAELSERIGRLSREALAFETMGSQPGDERAGQLGYEGLLMRREFMRSRAEGLGAAAEVQALERAQGEFGGAIAEQQQLVDVLRNDPLLQASDRRMHVAFLAYGGQGAVHEGSKLYACRVVLVGCQSVGTLKRYLPGEHTADHPVYGKELRGRWVEIELEHPTWATVRVLHAGRAPLLF